MRSLFPFGCVRERGRREQEKILDKEPERQRGLLGGGGGGGKRTKKDPSVTHFTRSCEGERRLCGEALISDN